MVFENNTKLASTLLLGGLMVCTAMVWAGCENTQQGTFETRGAVKNQAVSPQKSKADEAKVAAQAEYDARISAMTGRAVRSANVEYQQVALFGDLPASTPTPFKAQTNQSIDQHTFATEGACFDPKISPDGKWLVFASTQHTIKPDIYIKQVSSMSMTQLTSHPASDVQPTFSADSQKIAFCSDRTGNWDIFVVDVDGRNLLQVTDDPAPEMHPTFSPDGKKLAYCRFNAQAGQWEIWLLNLENSGQRKYLAAGLFPCFSTRENKIVYQRPNQRGSQLFGIWSITLTDDDQPSMPTQIAGLPDRALIGPQWSLDGRKIAYCSVHPSGKDEPVSDAQIWVVDADGRERMPVTEPGVACFNPTWGAEGRLFFSANRGDCENVWSIMPIIQKSSQVASAKSAPEAQESSDTLVKRQQTVNSEGSPLRANQPIQVSPIVPLQADQQSTAEVTEQ